MRSLLFVPGNSEKKQAKALASGADVLILDLEDSVAAADKQEARKITRDFVGANTGAGPELYVRVNDLTTGLTEDDLAAVLLARPAGIMLPKAEGGADVSRLSVMLRALEAEAGNEDGSTKILPIVTETPAGVLSTASYAGSSPRLSGLTWGAEDLSAAVGARTARDSDGRYTDLFRHARVMTLLAAHAAGVAPVDTVYPDFRNGEGLARECAEAERDGFTAKMAIHPAQVPVINEAFTPSAEAVAQSRRVVEAFAAAGNPGVLAINGKMYDRPHLRLAERLLKRAEDAGVA